jgi:hypothetical protein
MRRLLNTAIAVLSILAALRAQGGFAELKTRLDAERDALVRAKDGRLAFDDVQKLATSAAAQLERFLAASQGDDAANARLMLANVWLDVGKTDAAKSALLGFDPAATAPLALVAAAELAARIGDDALRERLTVAAVDAEAPLEQRMALAIFLATRLVDLPRAEGIFAAAKDAAKDDETRAHVAWYRVNCTRAREDVEEDAWLEELKALEKAYPKTYWGGVARDRLRALESKPGDAAIPFAGTSLDGQRVALTELAGKVVLVEFWGERAERAGPFLAKLHADYAERGLVIVGVAAVEDRARATALASSTGRVWPQLFDGRGLATDLALRFGVERLPELLLIDRQGKLAVTSAWIDDADGRTELRDAIERALGKS